MYYNKYIVPKCAMAQKHKEDFSMAKMKKNLGRIVNILCVVLLIGVLVTQFLPFWSYEAKDETVTVSIDGYVWFPEDHKELTKDFGEILQITEKKKIQPNLVIEAALLFVACVVSIIFLVAKSGHKFTAVLPLITGILGIKQYLGNYLFQIGQNWQLHLAVCIVLAVVAASNLVLLIAETAKSVAAARAK